MTAELAWDMTIPNDKIVVKVEQGFVTLTAVASRVFGVVGVSNELKVLNSATSTDVRERIEAALKRSALVDTAKIPVSTEG